MNAIAEVPTGFVPNQRTSPLTEPWEPIWLREHETMVQLGVRIAAAHCNSRGFLHGGVIASLADNAMGLSLAHANAQRGGVTVHLSVDYLRSGQVGQWLQIEPRLVRTGGTLGFMDALITADGETIARADAIFRIMP
jgi:uncharacterized protein (TIGR00369 family)